MKVVMMNYDFKVFWKGRMTYLHHFLISKNIEFYALELFGKGSPYAFDSAYAGANNWWTCLFPGNSADEISKDVMKAKLFKMLDDIKPDVIIASSIVFFAGALGLRWAKKNKKKFIMFENAKPSQFIRNGVVQKVKDTLIGQADALWLPSDDYDAEYPEFKAKGALFFYGYCCVDNRLFQTHQNSLNQNILLCVARLVPIKNIDALLKSWKIVETANTGYALQIIGDGPELEKLQALAAGLDLNTVKFVGAVDNQEILPYFEAADGFILPSLSETWGLVVNEAMAAGLPVLLSNKINAAHTLLIEGETGFGFEPTDIDAMANAILRYINLPAGEKLKMSKKSAQLISTMDYEHMGKRLYDALLQLEKRPYKKPGIVAGALIKLWDGRYSTFAWNRL